MAVDIKKTLEKLANKAEVAEAAVHRIADVLITEGYELSKPTKNATPPEKIEAINEAERVQGLAPGGKTPADIAVEKGVESVPASQQLRVQPEKK